MLQRHFGRTLGAVFIVALAASGPALAKAKRTIDTAPSTPAPVAIPAVRGDLSVLHGVSADQRRITAELYAPAALRVRAELPEFLQNGSSLSGYIADVTAGDPAISSQIGSASATTVAESVSFPNISVLNSSAASPYAGLIVQAKPAYLAQGALVPIALPGGGGTVSLITPGYESAHNVKTQLRLPRTDALAVLQARRSLDSQKNLAGRKDLTLVQCVRVDSAVEAKMAFNLPAGGSEDAAVAAFFAAAAAPSPHHLACALIRHDYTLAYMPDGLGLGAFFAPGTTVAQAKPWMTGDSPPAFVSSVSYGTAVYALVDTPGDLALTTQAVANVFAGIAAGQGAGRPMTSAEHNALGAATVRLLTVGSRQSPERPVGAVITNDDGAKIRGYLDAMLASPGADRMRDQHAPIAYTLHYLDFIPVRIAESTYVRRDR